MSSTASRGNFWKKRCDYRYANSIITKTELYMKSHAFHIQLCFFVLRKKFHLVALHHAIKTAVLTQEFDGGGGDVGAGGEILDGDELSVLPRLDDCLCRLLPHAGECGEGREEGVLMEDEFLRVGGVEVDGLAGEAAQVHFPS